MSAGPETPSGRPSPSVGARLQRLASLSGTDEGFFVLALHSFVERYAHEADPILRYEEHFDELVWHLGQILKDRRNLPHDRIAPLVRIIKEHKLTHRVRHDFEKLDREEAMASVHNFLGFCQVCGIGDPALDRFRESLKLWDEKTPPAERGEQLRRMQRELLLAQKDNAQLVERVASLETEQKRITELNLQIRRLSADLDQERIRAAGKSERVDTLREELNGLRLERKDLLKSLERYQDLEQYLEYLDRFTLYTRTRADYERSVMKLTPEQQQVVDGIDLSHDFLVKGGAGTGKTLVLLHALGRLGRQQAAELGLEPARKTVLLTFTNTLVKYDRYLAEIMDAAGTGRQVQTADSFFLARLKAIDGRYWIDYEAMKRLSKELNSTEFLSSEELATEVEELILGNEITKEEYVDNRTSRRGMRQPLSTAQRAIVWSIQKSMTAEMERSGGLSKNYSCIKIVENLQRSAEGGSGGPLNQGIDYIFLDESQDLSAVGLHALKLLARRALLMAGDLDQSIYGVFSPYKRAGVGIVGRTRILKTNFRNTCPIHDVAEAYRHMGGAGLLEPGSAAKAFREGPVPEIYTASNADQLQELLVSKLSLFIDKLDYDPENITVLAPTNAELACLGALLRGRGFEAVNIRDEGFTFRQERVIRLSTLHGSKGLDFPVVLLYLAGMHASSQYDEGASDRLLRNLIYVAMTRAMDNLNVFMIEDPQEPALRDLTRAFRDYQDRQLKEAGGK